MDVKEVKRQIKSGQLDRFYVFTGEEVEAQRIYINKIAEVTGRTVQRLDTVSDVVKFKGGLLSTPRLFVVLNDMDFIKAEKAWQNLEDVLKDKMLILQLSEVDKRKKFYKYFEQRIVTFNYIDADILYKYVQQKCRLSGDNSDELIRLCECNYGRLLLEMDKINQYSESTGKSVDESFEDLVADRAIYRPPEDAIFDFVDAVLQARPKKAYQLLEDCKAIGEPSLRLISVLYSNTKRVLQVQTCSSSDICKSTGLSAWDVKCARRNLGFWDGADLVSFLKVLQKVEKRIKTGEIEEGVAVEFALAHIF